MESLLEDKFLQVIIGKPAWCISKPAGLAELDFSRGPDSFAHAKVSCRDIASIKVLEESGFNLIDTNIQLEHSSDVFWIDTQIPAGYDISFAEAKDAEIVEKVAYTSFSYSRFHLDPLITETVANYIKKQWASNFFKGKRGDFMVVSTWKGEAIGFCQILSTEEEITIDLIAVDRVHHCKGIASAMIKFVARECGKCSRMVVGTQISNIPSLRMYGKLGFQISDASYIFHYHGPLIG